jgi:hypothetical protein
VSQTGLRAAGSGFHVVIIQVVIWLLPVPLPDTHHPYKYRLHYQNADGSDYIRYDNERGKGDHRHIGGIVNNIRNRTHHVTILLAIQ